jgi:hypothetical protein
MPSTWNFPRRRHLLLQTVMCTLLGGTVALAALVDYRLHEALYIPLANSIVDGPITFRLPAGWKTSVQSDDSGSVTQMAVEPTPGGGRVLSLSRQRVDRLMPPVEYLHISGRLAGNMREQPADTLNIDGWPAQIMAWLGMRRSGESAVETEAVLCCVILPDYQAITLRLDKPSPMDAADRRLIREVLESLSFTGLDHPGSGRLDLGAGDWVDVPSDFTVFPQPDPLRRDRMVVSQGQWISAQFIPIALADQPVESLRQLLAADEHQDSRDPAEAKRWLFAQISQSDQNHWIIQEPIEPEILVHHLATLTTNAKGQGLLVVLTTISPATDADLDQAWTELENEIHLDGSANMDDLLRTGAAAVADKPPLAQPPRQEWQIWQRGGSAQGWTIQGGDTASRIRVRQSRLRNWEGTVTQMLEQTSPLRRSGDYSIQVQRSDAEAEPFSRFGNLFQENTNVSDTISMMAGMLESTTVDRSPAFVPSAALGGWLASLPDKPLALWTDRFVGVESELLLSPVLLLVRPIHSASPALRCLEVELSGTGQLSRWYFQPDGTLDHAEFPGNLTMRPSAADKVQSALGNDPRFSIQGR